MHSHTVSVVQWVNPLLPVLRDPRSIPRGVLMWNQDPPVSVVSLLGDPDAIDHCGLMWGGLHTEPSLGPCANNVIIPPDLTQLTLSQFHAHCRSSFSLLCTFYVASSEDTYSFSYEAVPCYELAVVVMNLLYTLPLTSHHNNKRDQYVDVMRSST